jgi:hypothetical protein
MGISADQARSQRRDSHGKVENILDPRGDASTGSLGEINRRKLAFLPFSDGLCQKRIAHSFIPSANGQTKYVSLNARPQRGGSSPADTVAKRGCRLFNR